MLFMNDTFAHVISTVPVGAMTQICLKREVFSILWCDISPISARQLYLVSARTHTCSHAAHTELASKRATTRKCVHVQNCLCVLLGGAELSIYGLAEQVHGSVSYQYVHGCICSHWSTPNDVLPRRVVVLVLELMVVVEITMGTPGNFGRSSSNSEHE